jgi:solute carrier family 5 (sodium-coupled monocarboxylate transporter), member 8/12
MYLGLLLFAYYNDCDPLTTKLAKNKDSLLPLFVVTIFKDYRGVPGFFIAGVFGACLSSLSTGLNSLSAVLLEDYVKVFVKRQLSPLETQLWMRGVVIFFGITSVLLVLVVQNLGGVLQLSISFSSMTLGPLLGLFLVGMTMPWIKARAALTGGVCAFLVLATFNIRAQVAVAGKELIFQPKPTYTTNCSYTWDNSTVIDPNDVSYYYSGSHLSYMYYNLLGVLTCGAVSNVATLIFGRNTPKDVNPLLLAPFVRKLMSK